MTSPMDGASLALEPQRTGGTADSAVAKGSSAAAAPHEVFPAAWGDTLSRRRIVAVVVSVMLGMLLSALDQTVVGTAMPRIIADLNGLQHYAWVGTAYLLASAASMPIWGKLSDAFGRRRFFLVAAVFDQMGPQGAGLLEKFMTRCARVCRRRSVTSSSWQRSSEWWGWSWCSSFGRIRCGARIR